MFRISGTNADAIGKEVEKPPTLPEDISDDDFEEKVWDQMKTVFDPEIPINVCLLYTSPSPRDGLLSRMPSSA